MIGQENSGMETVESLKQRIRELEAQLTETNARLTGAIAASEKYLQASMTEYRKLEAEVVGLKEAGKRILKWWDEDCVSSTWPECGPEMEYLRHCLSTPTGSNLLAKVEAGEQIIAILGPALKTFKHSGNFLESTTKMRKSDADYYYEKVSKLESALAAYRATEKGVK